MAKNLKAELQNKTLLGIDYGEKKTGLALYRCGVDPCPTPYETLFQPELNRLALGIKKITEDEFVELLVIGLPTHADGSDSKSTKKVIKFTTILSSLVPDIPYYYQDEYLSSFEAKQRVKESKLKLNDPGYIDRLAASVILEDFLKEHT